MAEDDGLRAGLGSRLAEKIRVAHDIAAVAPKIVEIIQPFLLLDSS